MRKSDHHKHWRKIHAQTCVSKRPYQSEEEAYGAKVAYENRTGALMSYYRCHSCNKWHIGHQS